MILLRPVVVTFVVLVVMLAGCTAAGPTPAEEPEVSPVEDTTREQGETGTEGGTDSESSIAWEASFDRFDEGEYYAYEVRSTEYRDGVPELRIDATLTMEVLSVSDAGTTLDVVFETDDGEAFQSEMTVTDHEDFRQGIEELEFRNEEGSIELHQRHGLLAGEIRSALMPDLSHWSGEPLSGDEWSETYTDGEGNDITLRITVEGTDEYVGQPCSVITTTLTTGGNEEVLERVCVSDDTAVSLYSTTTTLPVAFFDPETGEQVGDEQYSTFELELVEYRGS